MKVAIVHNEPVPTQPDSIDVLEEAGMVGDALTRLEIPFQLFSLSHEPQAPAQFLTRLLQYNPDVVFNLIESSSGHDPRHQAAAVGMLEMANLPYTGADFSAILTTTDKTLAKAILSAYQQPTPVWQLYAGSPIELKSNGPWIIKPAWEDASVGIDEHAVIFDKSQMAGKLEQAFTRHGRIQPILIEQYINGREFNIAMIQHPDGRAEVLPPAEIQFQSWPDDKPKIVGYRAKWTPESFEYQNTARTFEIEEELKPRLRKIAQDCWQAFHLSGYARVDMRMNATGELAVIEINTNPGIAPDSGFMAAAAQGGYPAHELVKLMLATALSKKIKEVHR